MQATFQTRPILTGEQSALLDAWGVLHGLVERRLFAAYCAAGFDAKKVDASKPAVCARYAITARHFNAIWRMLKGKIDSRLEVDKLAPADTEERLKGLGRSLKRLNSQKVPLTAAQRRAYGGKKRRVAKLQARQARFGARQASAVLWLSELFRAQFALTENGFASHEEWLAAWREARTNTFYLLGSKDETSGNQSCTATLAGNGTLTLRLRLPDCLLAQTGGEKYALLENVWFEYGQVELYEALDSGQAISYRFLRDAKGWRVFASTQRFDTRREVDFTLGAIGVDVNADHLAVAETDRFGNLVNAWRVPCVTHGKTTNQRRAVVQQAARQVLRHAAAAGKPLVHEQLNFQRRKQELVSGRDPRYARMLSSLTYGSIVQTLESNALIAGVATKAVNPAYTSVAGRVKYAKPLGITIHQAAALVITRRGMGYGEAVPRCPAVPDGKGDHLIIEPPARNRSRHEWSHCARVRSKLLETLAGWHRLRKGAALEDAARAAPSCGPTGAGAVRPRPSNRQQHRSAGVPYNTLPLTP